LSLRFLPSSLPPLARKIIFTPEPCNLPFWGEVFGKQISVYAEQQLPNLIPIRVPSPIPRFQLPFMAPARRCHNSFGIDQDWTLPQSSVTESTGRGIPTLPATQPPNWIPSQRLHPHPYPSSICRCESARINYSFVMCSNSGP